MWWYNTKWLKIEKNRNNHNSEQVPTDVMQPHYASPTVINLSKHKLTQPQVSLLSKGLKFCPSPGEHNQGDLWRDLQKFHRSLRLKCMFNKPYIPRPEINHTKTELDRETKMYIYPRWLYQGNLQLNLLKTLNLRNHRPGIHQARRTLNTI